MEDVCT